MVRPTDAREYLDGAIRQYIGGKWVIVITAKGELDCIVGDYRFNVMTADELENANYDRWEKRAKEAAKYLAKRKRTDP